MSDLPHILLIEDNHDDCEATIRSLKKNHFINPIQWCKNGQEALNYLQNKNNQRPDLILLDLNMPGIDGRQVLQIIKTDTALKSIPVVILTTSADSKDVEQCYSIGASTYIQKPVNFQSLTEAIHTVKDYWFGVAILPGQER